MQEKTFENQQKIIFDGVGEFEIPEIEPTYFDSCDFISFNYAKSCKERQNNLCEYDKRDTAMEVEEG